MDNVLCGHTTGLLVLPLTGHGLVALPSPWFEKLSVDAQVNLQCLLLTWLVVQARKDYYNGIPLETQLTFFPFKIAGLQQTLLDGNPSILIAVQGRSNEDGIKSAMITGNQFSETMEAFLMDVSLGKALEAFIPQESISTTTPVLSLCDILHLPLSTFFTFQDDNSPLTTPVSFYWYSSYHPSCLPSSESLMTHNKPATTVCTLSDASLNDPALVLSVFQHMLSNGLSIAGIRTTYGKQNSNLTYIGTTSKLDTPTSELSMVLAVALRGPNAIVHWMDVVGPQDGTLAKVTDPFSLTAKFGSNCIHTLRTPFRAAAVLAKWFGGRACVKTCSVFGMSDPHTKYERRKRQRVRFSETQSESEDSISSPLIDLTFPPLISNRPRLMVPTYTKSLLVVSPNVPPSCYGSILASCNKLGFDIYGAKRIRLNAKRAAALDIQGEFLAHFTPSSTPPSPLLLFEPSTNPLASGVKQVLPPLPSVIFIIGQENSRVHCAALQHLIATNLRSLVKNNSHIEISTNCLDSPFSLVHVGSYTEDKLKLFGSFSAPISQANLPSVVDDQEFVSDEFNEELCFVAVPGSKSLLLSISLLDRIFRVTPQSDLHSQQQLQRDLHPAYVNHKRHDYGDPELVGMKIVPHLSRFHSKKLCPLVSSDPMYCQAVHFLTDKPAMLLIFRGVSCHKIIHSLVKGLKNSSHIMCLEQQLQYVVSRSLSEGISLLQLFFSGKDLFSDPKTWSLAPYLPHTWVQESDILQGFLTPRENLFSVVQLPLCKMKLALKVLDKLSRSGFQFSGISVLELSTEGEGILDVKNWVSRFVCGNVKYSVWLKILQSELCSTGSVCMCVCACTNPGRAHTSYVHVHFHSVGERELGMSPVISELWQLQV